MENKQTTKKILFGIGDGPEGITVWTDEDRAVVDWADDLSALYVSVSINGAYSQFGPFTLLNADRFLQALSYHSL
jgi:hypothetical protein